jgi:hypothetical protein
MNADDDRDLDRVLALYRECCTESGVEPLPIRGHSQVTTGSEIP